jgi:hypothetical protein
LVNWELSLNSRLRFGPVLTALFAFLSASFRTRAALQLEILALRHQIGVLQRSVKRPKLTAANRFFWAWISSVWNGWESRVSISYFPPHFGAVLRSGGRFSRCATNSEAFNAP